MSRVSCESINGNQVIQRARTHTHTQHTTSKRIRSALYAVVYPLYHFHIEEMV